MEKEAQDQDTQQREVEETARKPHHSKSKSPEISEEGHTPLTAAAAMKEAEASSYRQMRRTESRESSVQDCDGPGPTPETPGKRRKSHSPPRPQASGIHYISGNPSVELVKGVLHLYKDRLVNYKL